MKKATTYCPRPVRMPTEYNPGRDRATAQAKLMTAALLLSAVLIAYYPILGNYFRKDDFNWLAKARSWVCSPEGLLALRHGDNGVTITFNIVFRALYALGGIRDPLPYYWWMILSHWLAALSVLALGRRLMEPRSALIGALLFCVFWANHQTVTWIACGYRTIAAALFSAAVLLFILYRDTGRAAHLLGSTFLGFLALFTKEDASTLILVLMAADMLFLGAPPWRARRWIAYVPFICVYALYGASQPWVRPSGSLSGTTEGFYWPGPHMLRNSIDCVPQLLFPDLARGGFRSFASKLLPGAVLSVVTWFSVGGRAAFDVSAIWLIAKGRPAVKFLTAWMYVTFIPFTLFTYEYAVSARYRYLPAAGLCLLMGHGISRLMERTRTRPGALSALWAGVVFLLVVNVAALRVHTAQLSRASRIRREAIASLSRALPNVPPGTHFRFEGVSEEVGDVVLAVRILYDAATVGDRPDGPGRVDCLVEFDGSQVKSVRWLRRGK